MSTNCIGPVRLSRVGLRLATNYELSTSRTVVRVLRYVYENQTTFLRHLYKVFGACEMQDKSDFLYYSDYAWSMFAAMKDPLVIVYEILVLKMQFPGHHSYYRQVFQVL